MNYIFIRDNFFIRNLILRVHKRQEKGVAICMRIAILRLMQLIPLLTDTLFIERSSIIFDDGTVTKSNIDIASWVTVSYLFVPRNDGNYVRNFSIRENAKFTGGWVFLWTNMVQEMSVNILWDNTSATLSLLSLIQDNTKIEVDGIGKVSPGCQNVYLRVDQVNILLGEKSIVRGRPVLEVATDSITGWHSCKIHKISGDAFFYLQSHGIDASTAEGMLLSAEVRKHTNIIGEEGEEIGEALLNSLLLRKSSL